MENKSTQQAAGTLQDALRLLSEENDLNQSLQGVQLISQRVFNNANEKAQANQLGCIPAIIASLSRYSDSAEFQEQGLKALRNSTFRMSELYKCDGGPHLSSPKYFDCKREAINGGAFEAIKKALEDYISSEAVCTEGIWTLASMCGNDEEASTHAKTKGLKACVAAAAAAHPGSAAITTKAMFLNAALADDEAEGEKESQQLKEEG